VVLVFTLHVLYETQLDTDKCKIDIPQCHTLRFLCFVSKFVSVCADMWPVIVELQKVSSLALTSSHSKLLQLLSSLSCKDAHFALQRLIEKQ
jgi:hypothetical protein